MRRNTANLLTCTALILSSCTSSGDARVAAGDVGYRQAPSVIAVGETYDVQVWNSCFTLLEVGSSWYLPDRRIARPADSSIGFQPSDFPDDWDVVTFVDENGDGPSWVILDAQVTRLDDTTLEVTHQDTEDLISNFTLDPTPPEERQLCN